MSENKESRTAFEKTKEVDIPLSESDLYDLLNGEHFHWGYAGGVHLFLGDDSDTEV